MASATRGRSGSYIDVVPSASAVEIPDVYDGGDSVSLGSGTGGTEGSDSWGNSASLNSGSATTGTAGSDTWGGYTRPPKSRDNSGAVLRTRSGSFWPVPGAGGPARWPPRATLPLRGGDSAPRQRSSALSAVLRVTSLAADDADESDHHDCTALLTFISDAKKQVEFATWLAELQEMIRTQVAGFVSLDMHHVPLSADAVGTSVLLHFSSKDSLGAWETSSARRDKIAEADAKRLLLSGAKVTGRSFGNLVICDL